MKRYFSFAALLLSSSWASLANEQTPGIRKNKGGRETAQVVPSEDYPSNNVQSHEELITNNVNITITAEASLGSSMSFFKISRQKPVIQISLDYHADDNWGVDKKGTVWAINSAFGSWSEVDRYPEMKQVSVNDNAGEVWAVSKNNVVYYRTGGVTGNWREPAGKKIRMKCVSVDNAAIEIWGVGTDGNPYYRRTKDGVWTMYRSTNSKYSNKFSDIAVSGDGNHVYGVNTEGDVAYRRGRHGSWQWTYDNNKKQITVDHNGQNVFAVTENGQLQRLNAQHNGRVSNQKISNNLNNRLSYIAVSGNGRQLWSIDKNDNVWYSANNFAFSVGDNATEAV